MLPRQRLDIGWRDLLAASLRCCWPGDAGAARRRVEAEWAHPREGGTVACLSVRTGFDLLLSALALPRGSEVVVSAVTIRDMIRIVGQHGLVAVPVDLDMDRLEVDPAGLERAITPRTRLVLVAHLFGSRMSLDAIAEVCERRGVLLVEDCAQAYGGGGYRGSDAAHVRMFSFGPIKTNTALGGALVGFRDRALAEAVRDREARLPAQTRPEFLARIWKYGVLKLVSTSPVFALFVLLCRVLGRSHDEVISGAVRGFAGPSFFARIRRRPSYPLLSLLLRRLHRFRPEVIAARTAAARAAIALLAGVRRPGEQAAMHTHWVFPIRTSGADELVAALWMVGIDATRGASSLVVVEAPPGRPDLAPSRAAAAMREVLYLPVYPGVPLRKLEAMARVTVTPRSSA
jgi:perosamine synthetase